MWLPWGGEAKPCHAVAITDARQLLFVKNEREKLEKKTQSMMAEKKKKGTIVVADGMRWDAVGCVVLSSLLLRHAIFVFERLFVRCGLTVLQHPQWLGNGQQTSSLCLQRGCGR